MPLPADPSIAASLPAYKFTPVADIAPTVELLRTTFFSGRARPLEFRIQQLQKLYWGLVDVETQAIAAMQADLGRALFESYFADINFTKTELLNTIKNLKRWLADEPVTENIPWYLRMAHEAYLRKESMGVVLVIGAWNYPWNLNLIPFLGAIAAGNAVVLKPSEVSPHSAAMLAHLVEVSGLDPELYRVVQGGVEETTEALRCKWDKICYTGNGQVGKIVLRAAAEHLTPVILELGGKNPCIISPTADLPVAAKRIAWAKTLNSGQSCTAPDYLLIPAALEADFLRLFKSQLEQFYPQGIAASPDYSRIVNTRHFARLTTLLATTRGSVALGGRIVDEKDRLMEPTLIKLGHMASPADVHTAPWRDDPLMRDEIFGPIAAYLTYDPVSTPAAASSTDPATTTIAPALAVARAFSDTSLGAYLFSTTRAEQQAFLAGTRSGGACINEAFKNTLVAGLPFGGVGQSGTGAYRSRYSVDAFLHKRPVLLNKGGWVDWLMGFRFPPFAERSYKIVRFAAGRPGFARETAKL